MLENRGSALVFVAWGTIPGLLGSRPNTLCDRGQVADSCCASVSLPHSGSVLSAWTVSCEGEELAPTELSAPIVCVLISGTLEKMQSDPVE